MYEEQEYRVVEQRDAEGQLVQRRWSATNSDEPHRQGGPAFEEFDPISGKAIHLFWAARGQPSGRRIQINPENDVVTNEEHYRSTVLHRDNGLPAKILRNPKNGSLVSEEFYVGGYLHRGFDLPAVLEYWPENGQVRRLEYHQMGRLHRLNGPAVIEFDEEECIIHSEHHVDGRPHTKRPDGPGLR